MQSKNTSQFKKWLPAILLAVALHVLIVIGFVSSQSRKNDAESGQSNAGTQASLVADESENDSSLQTITANDPEQVATLSAKDLEEQNSDSEQNTDSSDSTEQASAKENAGSNANNSKKPPQKKSATDTLNQSTNNQRVSKPNSAQLTADITSQPTNQTAESGVIDNSPSSQSLSPYTSNDNPNERLLLARDVPSATTNLSSTDTTYDKTAKEIDALNDQISDGIKEIKEQKMKEIRAQQERVRAEYLKNTQRPSAALEAQKPPSANNPLTNTNRSGNNSETAEAGQPAISKPEPSTADE